MGRVTTRAIEYLKDDLTFMDEDESVLNCWLVFVLEFVLFRLRFLSKHDFCIFFTLLLILIFFPMAKSSFKTEHPLERRQAEAARIREKYPDRIPVIVERAEKTDVPEIDKKKYDFLFFGKRHRKYCIVNLLQFSYIRVFICSLITFCIKLVPLDLFDILNVIECLL